MGESGTKPGVGLLPANPCRTGWLLGASSSRDDCRVNRGWNGQAVAERVESNCIAENRCWSSQPAHLRFPFSILLHPAKISLASEMLTYFTLHLAKYPIQVGILAMALLAATAWLIRRPALGLSLFPIKGQHVARHT